MTTQTIMTFPISRGLEGFNQLTAFLNTLPLSGDWHFRSGTRFDQTEVAVDFEAPTDLALVKQRAAVA